MSELKKVTIYTDGFCFDNPGRGGYGAVLLYGSRRKEIFGGFRLTTNNRMEIVAAIQSLKELKTQCEVTLYSDSQYLVDSMMQGWVKNWQVKRKKGIKNVDLWKELLQLCDYHHVEFVWVKGHAGNPENELADELSVKGAEINKEDLVVDINYEMKSTTGDLPLLEPQHETSSRQNTGLTDLQKVILEAVNAFPGQLTRINLARILVASNAQRAEPYREHFLYGKFKHLSRTEVILHIDYLIVSGSVALQGKLLFPAK